MKQKLLFLAILFIAGVINNTMKAQIPTPVSELVDGEEYAIMNSNTSLANRHFYWDGSNLRTHSSGSVCDVKFKASQVIEDGQTYWTFQITSNTQNGKYLGRNGANIQAVDSPIRWILNYGADSNHSDYVGFTMNIKGEESRTGMMMNGNGEWVVSYTDLNHNDWTNNTWNWCFYNPSDFFSDNYEFFAEDWAWTGDGGRINQNNISVVNGNEIKLSGVTANNNACLKFKSDMTYQFYRSAKYFVITGRNLSTVNTQHSLWWLNGQAGNSYSPSVLTDNGDGTVTLKWYMRDLANNYRNKVIGEWVAGTTLFGLTPATPGDDVFITDIHYELIDEVEPYVFVAGEWAYTPDTGRLTQDCFSVDTDNNTITVNGASTTNDNGQHNVALTFKADKLYKFSLSGEKLIVKGENLSTVLDDSHLWWVNGINPNGARLAAKEATTVDGITTITWDLTEIPVENRTGITGSWTMDGIIPGFTTVFGLTPEDNEQPVIITDITFTSVDESSMYIREMQANNYGTICLPRNATTTDAAIYYVKEVQGTNLSLEELDITTHELEAGVPYIFKATKDNPSFTMKGEAVENPVEAVGLVGTFERIAVPKGDNIYILKQNKMYNVDVDNKAYVGANRAYIDLSAVPASSDVKENGVFLELVGYENTTDINVVDINSGTTAPVFDLQGRRVNDLNGKKGIFIQGGKKIMLK